VGYGYAFTAIIILTLVPVLIIASIELFPGVSTTETIGSPADIITLVGDAPTDSTAWRPNTTRVAECEAVLAVADATLDGFFDRLTTYWSSSTENFFVRLYTAPNYAFIGYLPENDRDCAKVVELAEYGLNPYQKAPPFAPLAYNVDGTATWAAKVFLGAEAFIDHTLGLVIWTFDNFIVSQRILINDFHIPGFLVISFFGVWLFVLLVFVIERIPFT